MSIIILLWLSFLNQQQLLYISIFVEYSREATHYFFYTIEIKQGICLVLNYLESRRWYHRGYPLNKKSQFKGNPQELASLLF